MKILFVCKGNNCRSQMAEAIYNRLTGTSDANSAGTQVEGVGETIRQFGSRPDVRSFTLDVMKNYGYDLSDRVQAQITPEMLPEYDMVINMAAKRHTPKWLSGASNYYYWPIPDPAGRGYKITDSVRKKN